jgi:hypothetical protein
MKMNGMKRIVRLKFRLQGADGRRLILLSAVLCHRFGIQNSIPIDGFLLMPKVALGDIPVASEVHVSRVAGPLTSDKRHLEKCLEKLFQYFASSDRLLQEGDLIPVPVDGMFHFVNQSIVFNVP